MAQSIETRFVLTAQDRASQAVKALNTELNKVQAASNAVKGAFIGLAAAAPVLAVKNSLDMADNLGKLAQRTGVAVEALSALRYQAELSDVSFEDLQTGLKKFSVNIADAAGGSKEALATFKALGLSQQDLTDGLTDSEGLLRKVADRFAGYADGAAKTALAVDLFGKSGDRMIVMLNEGAAGFDKARQELEKFGGLIGADFAKRAQDFNDNLTRLKFLSEGAAVQIGSALVPALNRMVEELIKGREIFGSFGKALLELGTINPFRTIQGNIESLNADLARFTENQRAAQEQGRMRAAAGYDPAIADAKRRLEFLQWQQRNAAMARFKQEDISDARDRRRDERAARSLTAAPVVPKGGGGGTDQGQAFLDQLRKRIVAIEQNEFATLRLEAAQKKVSDAAEPLIIQLQRETEFRTQLKEAQEKSEQSAAAELTRRQGLVNSVGEYVVQLEQETAMMRLSNEQRLITTQLLKLEEAGLQRNTAEFEAATKRIRDAVNANAAARIVEDTRTPFERLGAELTRLDALLQSGALDWDTYARAVFAAEEEFNGVAEAATKTRSIAEELGLTLSSSFEEAISEGNNLREVIRGLEKDILKVVTRKLVTEPLAKGLTDSLQGFDFSKLFGSVFSGFGGARALGGSVAAGVPHLVGEQGPELYIPRQSGTIVPNRELGAMGSPINITVNIPPGTSRETGLQTAARVGRAVQHALRQNG